jgi:hypothetical protein
LTDRIRLPGQFSGGFHSSTIEEILLMLRA